MMVPGSGSASWRRQNPNGDLTDSESLQAGVRSAEMLRKGWTKQGLVLTFSGLFVAPLSPNLGDYSTQVYVPYATSSYKQHSAISAASVVGNITRIAAYPIIAKLGDGTNSQSSLKVFGRAEMFILSILFQAIAHAIYVACKNVEQYIAGCIFNAIGSTGLSLTQQVFVADVTNLINRAVWSTLPESLTSASASEHFGWNETQNDTWWKRVYNLLWVQLDAFGALLLLLGLSIFLVPLSLTGSGNSEDWHKPSLIAMLVLGVVIFVLFLAWDTWVATRPFIPYRMVKNRTVLAACALGAFDSFHSSVFSVFFTSYLQVAGHYGAGTATRIDDHKAGCWAAFRCVFWAWVLLYLVDMGIGTVGSEAAFVTAKALTGISRGFYQTASQVSVQAKVSRGEVSVATAVFFAAMTVGGAIGTSVAGSIWRSTLPQKLIDNLPSHLKDQANSIFGSIVVAQKYEVGTPAREAIDLSYRQAQRLLGIAALAALVPMLGILFLLENVQLTGETGCEK
ncbi:hypothetical protein BDW75DRAFT_230215 [Aspergillus navahoensis]